MSLTLKEAESIIKKSKAKANELNVQVNIAIVDASSFLLAFVRMDDAFLGAVDIAIKKARTARLFNKNTGDLGKLSQPNGPLYNIEHSNDGLITFLGGIPIKNENKEVIGAIGVSGSTVENDEAIAKAGIA